jgi:hypothetical protein
MTRAFFVTNLQQFTYVPMNAQVCFSNTILLISHEAERSRETILSGRRLFAVAAAVISL